MAWLRNLLVHDAVQVLLHEEVVVAVEDDIDAVLDEQLMYGESPAGAARSDDDVV